MFVSEPHWRSQSSAVIFILTYFSLGLSSRSSHGTRFANSYSHLKRQARDTSAPLKLPITLRWSRKFRLGLSYDCLLSQLLPMSGCSDL